MTKLFSAFLLSIMCMGVTAQTATEKPVDDAESELSAEQSEELLIEEEDAADNDSFSPTEKINVDSSVSFPVDI